MKFIQEPTIGADIEVFLVDKDTKEVVSAEGIIKGTKHEPFKFSKEEEGFATSLDNVMAEFNIPPVLLEEEAILFGDKIDFALKYINGFIPKNLETLATPAARIDVKYLQTENAMLFGCEPDFNAWSEMENISPMPDGNLRSAGGHVHVGYLNPIDSVSLMIVKALDLYLSVPSVLQEPDSERKTLYGKAGAHRLKDYGVEYRSLSNYYLQSRKLTDWVAQNVLEAIEFVNSGGVDVIYEEGDDETIINAINNNDKALAEMLIQKYNIKLA